METQPNTAPDASELKRFDDLNDAVLKVVEPEDEETALRVLTNAISGIIAYSDDEPANMIYVLYMLTHDFDSMMKKGTEK